MKKCVCFLVLALVIIGCSKKNPEYHFPNQTKAIASIELLHNRNPGGIGTDESKMFLLLTLDSSEIPIFMDAIYALPTKMCGTPPPYGYGEYIAKVVYENGDIEMYGTENIVFIPAGEISYGVGDYIFAGNGFVDLLSQYIDIPSVF